MAHFNSIFIYFDTDTVFDLSRAESVAVKCVRTGCCVVGTDSSIGNSVNGRHVCGCMCDYLSTAATY